MKKMKFTLIAFFAVFVLSSCEEDEQLFTTDFEDLTLGESGYWDGSDKTGTLVDGTYVTNLHSGTIDLVNKYTVSSWGGSWSGFAISSKADSITSGWANQYSTIAGKGAAGSEKFALVFDTATILLPQSLGNQKPVSVMLTNSTYAYKDMQYGSGFSKKFAADDWFKVIIKGFDGTVETGRVEFYLADFRNGKSVLIRDWTEVSLKSLGNPDFITFGFESSDTGVYGINTPKYVCLDNLKVSVL